MTDVERSFPSLPTGKDPARTPIALQGVAL